jgi:hypothetical protein
MKRFIILHPILTSSKLFAVSNAVMVFIFTFKVFSLVYLNSLAHNNLMVEQHVFVLLFSIEGTTDKVFKFYMLALKH